MESQIKGVKKGRDQLVSVRFTEVSVKRESTVWVFYESNNNVTL